MYTKHAHSTPTQMMVTGTAYLLLRRCSFLHRDSCLYDRHR